MRLRPTLGACLIALFVSASGSMALADPEQEAACRLDCDGEAQQCMEACAEHPDPVECDADCRDRGRDCYERCS